MILLKLIIAIIVIILGGMLGMQLDQEHHVHSQLLYWLIGYITAVISIINVYSNLTTYYETNNQRTIQEGGYNGLSSLS